MIEGSFSYEVQKSVSNLSQNHKDMRLEPLVSAYASPHSYQYLCFSMTSTTLQHGGVHIVTTIEQWD